MRILTRRRIRLAYSSCASARTSISVRNPFPSRADVSSTNPATAANTAQLKGAFLTIIIASLLTDVIIATR